MTKKKKRRNWEEGIDKKKIRRKEKKRKKKGCGYAKRSNAVRKYAGQAAQSKIYIYGVFTEE